MPMLNAPSEAEIAREMVTSPTVQERMRYMPSGFRPFEAAPYTQYDPALAEYGTAEERQVMQAITDSPYTEDLMYLGAAEAGFDGSYEGLRDIFSKGLQAHYSGAATMPNFYTDRPMTEGQTHLDYASDVLEIMRSVYPEREAENNLLSRQLKDFAELGTMVSTRKDPVLQRGMPIQPELIPTYSTDPSSSFAYTREGAYEKLEQKAMDNRIAKLQDLYEANRARFGKAETKEEIEDITKDIVIIADKIEALERTKAEMADK